MPLNAAHQSSQSNGAAMGARKKWCSQVTCAVAIRIPCNFLWNPFLFPGECRPVFSVARTKKTLWSCRPTNFRPHVRRTVLQCARSRPARGMIQRPQNSAKGSASAPQGEQQCSRKMKIIVDRGHTNITMVCEYGGKYSSSARHCPPKHSLL